MHQPPQVLRDAHSPLLRSEEGKRHPLVQQKHALRAKGPTFEACCFTPAHHKQEEDQARRSSPSQVQMQSKTESKLTAPSASVRFSCVFHPSIHPPTQQPNVLFPELDDPWTATATARGSKTTFGVNDGVGRLRVFSRCGRYGSLPHICPLYYEIRTMSGGDAHQCSN